MTELTELLELIPDHIEYPIIEVDWSNKDFRHRWSKENYIYKLRIEKNDDKFLAFYVYTGFEGEEQKLPISDSELNQYLEYGCVLEYQDLSKPTLDETLDYLLGWLRKENLIE